MEQRLIDANELCDRIEHLCITSNMNFEQHDLMNAILDSPIIDPVKHGKWVYGEDIDIQCSLCGKDALTEGDYRQVKSKYCPNCGAKMDGGNNDM